MATALKTTEKQREAMRRWRLKHREYDLSRKRADRAANRERYIENCRRWFESHPGYKDAYNKEYYRKNKEKMLKTNAKWQEMERKSNPLFRLRQALSYRVHRAIKSHRAGRTMEITGCSIEFLKGYLESRWQPGMSWENYGRNGWHVDHIIPCSVFDFSDPVEIQQCFHYSNLQPLWAKDNLRKAKSVSENRKAKGFNHALIDD